MRRARSLLPVVLAALIPTACGGAGNAITFKLDPRHGSGLDGLAKLAPRPGGSRLTIDLTVDAPPPGTTAAVYEGSCDTIPQRRASPAVTLAGPELRIPLGATPATLARHDHAVALKRAGAMLACGDVPPGPVD